MFDASFNERFVAVKNKLLQLKSWDDLNEWQRGNAVLNIIDEDTVKYNNADIYHLFVKSHHILFGKGFSINLKMSFVEFQSIIGLMERYAKNWIYS